MQTVSVAATNNPEVSVTAANNPEKKKLNLTTLFAYGCGDIANNLYYVFSIGFIMYFCTDVVMVSASVVGIVTFVGRFWDAINDVVIGRLADKTETRWGKYRPWLIFCSIVLYPVYVLLFWGHMGWSTALKTFYVCAMFMIFTWCQSMAYVPYGALSTVMTKDAQERVKLSSARLGIGFVAIIAMSFTMNWIGALGGGDMRQGFIYITLIFGAIASAGHIFCGVKCKEVVKIPKSAEKEKMRISDYTALIRGNKPMMVIMFGMIVSGFQIVGRSSILAYYFRYYVGDYAYYMPYYLVYSICQMIGCFIAPLFSSRVKNKGTCVRWGSFIAGIMICTLGFFKITDNMIIWLVINGTSGICMGVFNANLWGIIPDAVEYGALKTGIRAGGITYAFCQFMQKFGMAIGTLLTGVVLEALGYVAGQIQNASTLTGINIIFAYVSGGLLIVCSIIFSRYKLDKKTHAEAVAELERRELENL